MKTIYITGCLGFIGSYITRACLNNGWYVKGIDKITYAANQNLLNDFNNKNNFSFVHCDIKDLKFLYDCDYVINTAAETHVGNSIVDSRNFIESNIEGTYNLLELIKNSSNEGGKKPILLHFSTDEVYGDISNGFHAEDAILRPSNPYSATKAAADMLILAWARTYNMRYIIVRPTNNYGIGQYPEKLIPKACKYIKIGKKIPLHNNGTPVRTWIHVDDTVRAVMHIIENNYENEIFNISGGFEQSNMDVVTKILSGLNMLNNNFDINNFIDFSYSRPGQDIRYSLDDSKLRSLGWSPTVDFDTRLPEIIQYYTDKFIW